MPRCCVGSVFAGVWTVVSHLDGLCGSLNYLMSVGDKPQHTAGSPAFASSDPSTQTGRKPTRTARDTTRDLRLVSPLSDFVETSDNTTIRQLAQIWREDQVTVRSLPAR